MTELLGQGKKVHSLTTSNIAIVKHTYTPTGGAEQELLRYLLPRAKSITYVSHPFANARGVPLNSKISFFEKGNLKKEVLAPLVKGPFPLLVVKDALFTAWYLRRRNPGPNLYIGVDNLNAFSGLILKRFGLVERVVYYVIDYAPDRFKHRSMQTLYRKLDHFCCYHSDAVWNVSASMEQARHDDGFARARSAPQIEVPLGNRFEEIPKLSPEKRTDGLITFLGSLTREQGLHLMLEALPKIKQHVPHARLRVIGDGPETPSLKQLAQELQIQDSVEFLGFIENDVRAAELIAQGSVAIAPYIKTEETYKRFADPGKIKIYLAAGLPIIISRVPSVAYLIDTGGAGIAIIPSSDNLADAVTDLLMSPSKRTAMGAKALELGKRFDWTDIFDHTFETTFAHWENRN